MATKKELLKKLEENFWDFSNLELKSLHPYSLEGRIELNKIVDFTYEVIKELDLSKKNKQILYIKLYERLAKFEMEYIENLEKKDKLERIFGMKILYN